MSQRALVQCAFASVLLFFGAGSCGSAPRVEEPSHALCRMLASARPFEGWVCCPMLGPFDPNFKLDPMRVADLVALEAALTKAPGCGATLIAMIWGQPVEAVERGRDAVLLDDSAENHADLACAYLYRARMLDQPQDLVWALEEANQALARNPTLVAARFNRALALARLQLKRGALEILTDLSTGDPQQDQELSQRGALLGAELDTEAQRPEKTELQRCYDAADLSTLSQMMSDAPQVGREWAEADLADTWAASVLAGKDTAASTAAVARVAAVLTDRGEDQALAQHLARHQQLPPAERPRLAQALRQFLESERAYTVQDLARTRACLQLALPVLTALRSDFRFHGRYRQIVCRYHEGQNRWVIEAISELMAEVDPQRMPSLTGRLLWLRALAHNRLEMASEALADLDAAATLFRHLGEWGNLGAILTMTAQTRDSFEAFDLAWSARVEAMAQVPWMDPRRKVNLLTTTSVGMVRMGARLAGLELSAAAVIEANAANNHLLIAITQYQRARSYLELARYPQAEQDLAVAFRHAALIPDDQTGAGVVRDIKVVAASVASHRDPLQALQLLDEVEQASVQRQSDHLLMQVFEARARSLIALQRVQEAEENFERGAAFYEIVRGRIGDGELRIAFQEVAARFFDLWIGLHGPDRKGLEVLERYRAQALREALRNGNRPSLDALQAGLGAHDQVLIFHQQEQRLLCWSLRRKNLEGWVVKVGKVELARRIGLWRRALRAHRGADEKQAAALYRQLFVAGDPVADPLGRLVIVPHQDLWGLPFGFLMTDPQLKTRLVDKRNLVVAPSLSAYERLNRRVRKAHPLLVAFGYGSSIREAPLRACEDEAREVAQLFGGELVLQDQVQPQSFLSALARADILHYAGHAVTTRSGQGQLLLSPGDRDNGRLGVEHLARAEGAPELVVLSACGTISGGIRHSEAPQALAMPFLAMGTPAVVGSLWQVDDRQTRDLILEFYKAYQAGMEAPEALRQAILAQIAKETTTTLGTLAAFQVWG